MGYEEQVVEMPAWKQQSQRRYYKVRIQLLKQDNRQFQEGRRMGRILEAVGDCMVGMVERELHVLECVIIELWMLEMIEIHEGEWRHQVRKLDR